MKKHGLNTLAHAAAILMLTGLLAAPPLFAQPIIAPQAPPANVQNQALKFDSLSINFGETQEGEKVLIVYEVENVSDRTVGITQIRPSCGCTATPGNPDKLEPGEKSEIRLSFDTRNRRGQQRSSATIHTDEPAGGMYRLTFEGLVLTDLLFDRDMIDFGEVDEGTPVIRRFRLLNQGDRDIQIVSLKSNDERIQVRLVPEEEFEARRAPTGAGAEENPAEPLQRIVTGEREVAGLGADKLRQQFHFEATLPGNVPQSNVYTTIIVETDHPQKSEMSIPARARIVGQIVPSPVQLVAVVEPHGKMERQIALRSRNGVPFEILEIVPADDYQAEFSVEDLGTPDAKRLRVTMKGGDTPGRINSELTLQIRTEDGQTHIVILPVIMVVRDMPAAPQQSVPGVPQRPAPREEPQQQQRPEPPGDTAPPALIGPQRPPTAPQQ